MKHRNYTIEWMLLATAVLVALVSVVLDFYMNECNCFARSGSLVVLLAAIVEYKISSHIYEDIQRAQFQQKLIDLHVPLKAKPPKNRKRLSLATHAMLFLGTIIWGYSDLVWP